MAAPAVEGRRRAGAETDPIAALVVLEGTEDLEKGRYGIENLGFWMCCRPQDCHGHPTGKWTGCAAVEKLKGLAESFAAWPSTGQGSGLERLSFERLSCHSHHSAMALPF